MNREDLQRLRDEAMKDIERAIERQINAPVFSRDAMGDVCERVDAAEQAAARERFERILEAGERRAAEATADLELRERFDAAVDRLGSLSMPDEDVESWRTHLDRLADRPLDEQIVRDLEAVVEGAIEDARRGSSLTE